MGIAARCSILALVFVAVTSAALTAAGVASADGSLTREVLSLGALCRSVEKAAPQAQCFEDAQAQAKDQALARKLVTSNPKLAKTLGALIKVDQELWRTTRTLCATWRSVASDGSVVSTTVTWHPETTSLQCGWGVLNSRGVVLSMTLPNAGQSYFPHTCVYYGPPYECTPIADGGLKAQEAYGRGGVNNNRGQILYETKRGAIEVDRFDTASGYAAALRTDEHLLFRLGNELGFRVVPF